jgi:predicted transcriptional regulator
MTIYGGQALRTKLGNVLRSWREAHHLSREEVAVLLDCSCYTVCGYERGKREALISVVLKLEKAHPGLIKKMQQVLR